MTTVTVSLDDRFQEVRTCKCSGSDGARCTLTFIAAKDSTRQYFNSHHKERAKSLRRKFKDAGVPLEAIA